MKRFAALGLSVLLLLAMAAGCQPSRETLLRQGIDARPFDQAEFSSLLEEAILSGEQELQINYLGRQAVVERAVEDGLSARERMGYAAGRFLASHSVTCAQGTGYVATRIQLERADEELLADMARQGPDALAVEAYGEESLEALLMHMLETKQERALRLYAWEELDAFNEGLRRDMDALVHTNYAYAYLVESAQWVLSEYAGQDGEKFLELDLTLAYVPDTLPLGDIPVVDTKLDMIDALVEGWAAGEEKVTLILENLRPPEKELFNWINTAEVNSATLACEGDSIWYEVQDSPGPRQVGRFWLEFDAADKRIAAAQTELDRALAKEALALRAQLAGASAGETAYRAIFDRVLELAEYDDEIRVATEKKTLTQEMQILRSAYGVLVAGKTVCTGYARAFQALCDALDLPCWTVNGTQNGEGHAWNMVRIGDQTLYVDCTFGDTGGRPDRYFLFTAQELQKWDYEMDEGFITPW